jgi:hypothetical protein
MNTGTNAKTTQIGKNQPQNQSDATKKLIQKTKQFILVEENNQANAGRGMRK